MRTLTFSLFRALTLALAVSFAGAPALAEPPPWAKGKGKDRDERAEHDHHFSNHHWSVVHDYYEDEYRAGRCPPGLAKKHNGCMPPGQAKKWKIGRPLPRDVVFYDLPPALVVKIGAPPEGYKYVRVASDILLVAAGTSMVVDAINDLGRR